MGDWIIMTTLGSRFEERYSPKTGRFEHRRQSLADDVTWDTPWHPGRAPIIDVVLGAKPYVVEDLT